MLGLLAAILGVFVALPVCLTAFALAYRWLQARHPAAAAAPAQPAVPAQG
jgi:hypothetical protein